MAQRKLPVLIYLSGALALALVIALIVLRVSHESRGIQQTRADAPSSTVKLTPRQQVSADGSPGTTPRKAERAHPVPSEKAMDWTRQYNTASDYFSFVKGAAASAAAGDGRAALYIGRALNKCLGLVREYAQSDNPEADFERKLVSQPALPSWVLDKQRKDFNSCAGFIKGDAFADLPQRTGGYSSSAYWMTQAYDDGDPLALAMHAGRELTGLTADANFAVSDSVQADMETAVASGDPAAIFQVSQILTSGLDGSATRRGFALAIAACELGYDCSANNPDLAPYLGCAQNGLCASGLIYSDVIKKSLGEAGYAEAYGQAKNIESALASRDIGALDSYVKLKPGS